MSNVTYCLSVDYEQEFHHLTDRSGLQVFVFVTYLGSCSVVRLLLSDSSFTKFLVGTSFQFYEKFHFPLRLLFPFSLSTSFPYLLRISDKSSRTLLVPRTLVLKWVSDSLFLGSIYTTMLWYLSWSMILSRSLISSPIIPYGKFHIRLFDPSSDPLQRLVDTQTPFQRTWIKKSIFHP